MNKVLITGGAGFIGSHITEELLYNNYKVVVIDNLSSGSKSNLPIHDNLTFYQLSILDNTIENIFSIEKPDYVIHLAAQTSVTYSTEFPYQDALMNICSSVKILELCKKHNIKKFITASSAAVYGTPQYLPVDEKHPTNPISPYGLSKLTMEKYILMSEVPYIIFRFSNVFGPRQNSSKESGVIAIFHNSMKSNSNIKIFGDGEQIRDFICVKDIAQICLAAIKSDTKNEIINFSSNKGITVNKLFELMQKEYSYNFDATYLPPREGDIKDSILSNKKAMTLFENIKISELLDGIKLLKDHHKQGANNV